MLGIIGFLCTCSVGFAEGCDITLFDQTAPPAIVSDVANRYATFRWASDADLINGQSWLWHYIRNTSPLTQFSARWDKAGITFTPVPPGDIACNRKFVAGFQQPPDPNAPIKYSAPGTSLLTQDAAVYVERQTALQAAGSIFDTAYLDQQGKKINIHVGIFFQPNAGGYSFQLDVAPQLTVAISRLSSFLTSSELSSIRSSATTQRADVQLATLGASAKEIPAELKELLSPEELQATLRREYIFFSGAQKTSFRVETPAVQKITAEIAILDREARILLIGDAEILAPQR